MNISILLLVLSLICFVMATFNVATKFNLVAAGLALAVLSALPLAGLMT